MNGELHFELDCKSPSFDHRLDCKLSVGIHLRIRDVGIKLEINNNMKK